MSATLVHIFMKIDPDRKAFLEFPKEVRDVVYKNYFGESSKEVYPLVEKSTGANGVIASRVWDKGPGFRDETSPSEDTDSRLMTMSLLLINKFMHDEVLEPLYESRVFEICDHPGNSTARLQELPRIIFSNIRHLQLNINFFGYKLARVDDKGAGNMWRQSVTMDPWIMAKKMPSLHTLEIKCYDCLEVRNLIYRFVTNTTFLSDKTHILVKALEHGPENATSEIDMEEDWLDVEGSTTTRVVPAWQQLIFKGRMLHTQRMALQDMTFRGHRLKKLRKEHVTYGMYDVIPFEDTSEKVYYDTFDGKEMEYVRGEEGLTLHTYCLEPIPPSAARDLAKERAAEQKRIAGARAGRKPGNKDVDELGWGKSLRGKLDRLAFD